MILFKGLTACIAECHANESKITQLTCMYEGLCQSTKKNAVQPFGIDCLAVPVLCARFFCIVPETNQALSPAEYVSGGCDTEGTQSSNSFLATQTPEKGTGRSTSWQC